jgi:hypothetical protein
VRVSVVDAASIEGVWTSLRHRVRQFPAVIVDGQARPLEADHQALDAAIAERLRSRRSSEEGVMPAT